MILSLYILDSIKWIDLLRVYDGTRYLVLFGNEKYDSIYDKIRYLMSAKSGTSYIISHNYAIIKVDSYPKNKFLY